MTKIPVMVLTPVELAATRATVESLLKHYGAALEEQKPELYEALLSVKGKMTQFANAQWTVVRA